MGMRMVHCATSPSLSRANPTPPVPQMDVRTTCHGAPPQLTTAETRNSASAQVNVSLKMYSPMEIIGQRSARWGHLLLWHVDSFHLLILAPNYHLDSSVHIWRKRRRSWMCLPLRLPGWGIWQLYHRGPQWWLPLVCHHKQLWQGQEIWLLSQSWWVAGTTMHKHCGVLLQWLVILLLLLCLCLGRHCCNRWKFRGRALPLPVCVPG